MRRRPHPDHLQACLSVTARPNRVPCVPQCAVRGYVYAQNSKSGRQYRCPLVPWVEWHARTTPQHQNRRMEARYDSRTSLRRPSQFLKILL